MCGDLTESNIVIYPEIVVKKHTSRSQMNIYNFHEFIGKAQSSQSYSKERSVFMTHQNHEAVFTDGVKSYKISFTTADFMRLFEVNELMSKVINLMAYLKGDFAFYFN